MEVSVKQEWARVNEVSGKISTSGLIAPVMTRNDGQFRRDLWDLCEDCPISIVQLYLGNIKVLTNISMSLVGGLVIVEAMRRIRWQV
jgi:hypothetical protein